MLSGVHVRPSMIKDRDRALQFLVIYGCKIKGDKMVVVSIIRRSIGTADAGVKIHRGNSKKKRRQSSTGIRTQFDCYR